jgi:hypothetical protein
MAEPVAVEIVEAAGTAEPRGAQVRYVVRNGGDATLWLVDDDWLVWRAEGSRIELSYARAPLQPSVVPFGYFPPAVASLDPGAEIERVAELTWPQRLDGLWNAEDSADPPPGRYELSVRVGFGETPEPPPPQAVGEGVEAPVLGWQREAVSEPVELVLP